MTSELSTVNGDVNTLELDMSNVSNDVSNLTNDVADISNAVGSLTDLQNEMKTKVDSLTNYVLPVASSTTLGGVKVDGTTISIDTNGVISVIGGVSSGGGGGSSGGGGTTEDIFTSTKLGTFWANYDDIPTELQPYCIKITRSYEAATITYSSTVTAKEFYHYQYGVDHSICTDYFYEYYTDKDRIPDPADEPDHHLIGSGSNTQGCGTKGVLTMLGTNTKITDYSMSIKYPDGHSETYLYASVGDIGVYKVATAVKKNVESITTLSGTYRVGSSFEDTSTTYDTFVSSYGPGSGYSVSGYKYTLSSALTSTQRTNLWDAGCFGSDYTDTGTYASYRTRCVNGTSGGLAYNKEANFGEQGVGYKLSQRYGLNVWIYVGKPTA